MVTQTQITEGVAGAVATAEQVQNAVASQTTALGKVEAGLQEFLAIGPEIAGAIDPAISGASTAVATMLQTLLEAFQAFHAGNVVSAATAAVPATVPAVKS